MTFAVCKYINCSVDKLMVQALVINYTTNYSTIITKTITTTIIITTATTITTTTTTTIIISLIIIINLLQTFENRPISGTNIAN